MRQLLDTLLGRLFTVLRALKLWPGPDPNDTDRDGQFG